jgi:hypothetical protein
MTPGLKRQLGAKWLLLYHHFAALLIDRIAKLFWLSFSTPIGVDTWPSASVCTPFTGTRNLEYPRGEYIFNYLFCPGLPHYFSIVAASHPLAT